MTCDGQGGMAKDLDQVQRHISRRANPSRAAISASGRLIQRGLHSWPPHPDDITKRVGPSLDDGCEVNGAASQGLADGPWQVQGVKQRDPAQVGAAREGTRGGLDKCASCLGLACAAPIQRRGRGPASFETSMLAPRCQRRAWDRAGRAAGICQQFCRTESQHCAGTYQPSGGEGGGSGGLGGGGEGEGGGGGEGSGGGGEGRGGGASFLHSASTEPDRQH